MTARTKRQSRSSAGEWTDVCMCNQALEKFILRVSCFLAAKQAVLRLVPVHSMWPLRSFDGKPGQAIISLARRQFEKDGLQKLMEGVRFEETQFQNDVYSKVSRSRCRCRHRRAQLVYAAPLAWLERVGIRSNPQIL